MPPEAPSSAPIDSTIRTIEDVRRERGPEYPQKHGGNIRNPGERRDCLIAAYALITRRNKSAFMSLFYAGGHTRRMQMVNFCKGEGKQLGLMGIFRLILSFDLRTEITLPTESELRPLLEEMQSMFEPQKPKWTPTPGFTEPNYPVFMGRRVTSHYILAIIDSLPVLETPVVPTPPSPKNLPPPPTNTPVPATPSRVIQTLQAPPTPSRDTSRRYVPPAPRRGEKPQHVGRRAWVVPARVREELQRKEEESRQKPPEKPLPQAERYTAPTFSSLIEALDWLRKKPKWAEMYQQLFELRDDLAIMAMLRRGNEELLSVLQSIKQSFGGTLKHIIGGIFHPPVPESTNTPTTPKETSPAPTSNPMEADTQPISIDLTPAHEAEITRIVTLHKEGKHRLFWKECEKLQGTEILSEVSEVQAAFGHTSLLHSIGYIGGQEFTEKDISLYRTHHWSQRIIHLSGVAGQLQRLIEHDNAKSMPVLKRFLEDVKIRVPDKRKWQGFEELEVPERTLFEVVAGLVKSRIASQRRDEESTKKLLRVVRQIMGAEPITADDEDIKTGKE